MNEVCPLVLAFSGLFGLFTPFYPWLKEGGHCEIFPACKFSRVEFSSRGFDPRFKECWIGVSISIARHWLEFSTILTKRKLLKDLSCLKDEWIRKELMSGIKHTIGIVYSIEGIPVNIIWLHIDIVLVVVEYFILNALRERIYILILL